MSADTLLESVRGLAPLIEAARPSLDSERGLPAQLAGAVMDAGLLRLWTPRELGGAELDPISGLRVIAAVSELDGSVGWNVMISSAYTFFAGRLSARAAEHIFGARRAAVAGQLEPGGKADISEGGYRATGRWPFGSGCKQATWFLAQCVVHENGNADAIGNVWENVKAGKPVTLEQRAAVRIGCVNAGVSAAKAVDICYNLGGSASIFEKNLLERCFRDVHTASQHVAVAPKTLEVVGRVLLGMEPQGLI